MLSEPITNREMELVRTAWDENRSWDALVAAWQRVGDRGSRDDLPGGGGDFILRACCQAVTLGQKPARAQAILQDVNSWLEDAVEPPNCLVMVGDTDDPEWAWQQRNYMLKLHLACVQGLLLSGSWTSSEKAVSAVQLDQLARNLLQAVAAWLPKDVLLPLGFVRDLLDRLIGNYSSRRVQQTVWIGVGLVKKGDVQNEGDLTRAKLELLSEGNAKVFPDPVMAFVSREPGNFADTFAGSEQAAWEAAIGLFGWDEESAERKWAQLFDVRWQFYDPASAGESTLPASRLVGNSAGGAFAIGIAQLLARQRQAALDTEAARDPV
jgi:hypothetical protein